MKIVNGFQIAQKLESKIKKEIKRIKERLSLAIISVGENSASKIYIQKKKEACQRLGIQCQIYNLSSKVSLNKIIELVQKINRSSKIHGLIIQLPLPPRFNSELIFNYLDPLKDVDGLSPLNLGFLASGQGFIIPPTVQAILEIIDYYKINLRHKKVVLIGYSNLIGKPLSFFLINRGATITICHKETKNLDDYTRKADILIVAAGKPKLITKNMVKRGVIVIDVGINKIGKKIVGDVDFNKVKDKASLITPVPGGVGPITIMKLLQNLLQCVKLKRKRLL